MVDLTGVTNRCEAVGGVLDERSRRLVAAASVAIGRGGVSVSRAADLSHQLICEGVAKLSEAVVHPPGRVSASLGGRKKVTDQDPFATA